MHIDCTNDTLISEINVHTGRSMLFGQKDIVHLAIYIKHITHSVTNNPNNSYDSWGFSLAK